jgi:hypothetical protein
VEGKHLLRFRDKLLMRAFGRPEGLLGRIGGRLMVCGKAECGRWLAASLGLADDASILEVGCGPGVCWASWPRRRRAASTRHR